MAAMPGWGFAAPSSAGYRSAVARTVAALRVMYDDVQTRAEAIEASHGPWPCRAGCDACCRSLGALPALTDVEADVLFAAIDALPPDVRALVHRRIEALGPSPCRPIVCPLLDESTGRCRVYEARPLACRTYGYYAGRDGDYWCERVTAHLGDRRDTLIAGNQIALDRARDVRLGESVDLVTRHRARRSSPSA